MSLVKDTADLKSANGARARRMSGGKVEELRKKRFLEWVTIYYVEFGEGNSKKEQF